MKKIIIGLILALMSLTANAQLYKVGEYTFEFRLGEYAYRGYNHKDNGIVHIHFYLKEDTDGNGEGNITSEEKIVLRDYLNENKEVIEDKYGIILERIAFTFIEVSSKKDLELYKMKLEEEYNNREKEKENRLNSLKNLEL